MSPPFDDHGDTSDVDDPALAPADLAQRERAYSPSSCIGGDYQPFIEAYGRRSDDARARATALGGRWLTLRCGSAPQPEVQLCLPSAASARRPVPALVFIHGGYWQELSAAQSLWAAASCAAQGLAYAAIDYTLAPAASVADIVVQCRQALSSIHEQAQALGVDTRHIVVAGSSAGAHLAAMMSLPQALPAGHRPQGAVLVSGVYWLAPLVGTSINAALGLDLEAARAVSPGRAALTGFPRTVLCWGEVETEAFKAQGRRFAARLADAGTACTTFEVPQRNHFDIILDLAEPGTPLGDQTLALLRQV